MPRVAVIQYPGVNCEYETQRALQAVGLDADIFRWNLPVESLREFDAYVLPGGFSYQDRIRAGAVAAKKPIIRELIKQLENGKPALGICNGAQVLVESGLVPAFDGIKVEMALAKNMTEGRSGYYCNWVLAKIENTTNQSLFLSDFAPNELIPIPVAHGEGRFISADVKVLEKLETSGQVALRYCDPLGHDATVFPWNPNGSFRAIAGITNPEGNVLAMMPHPERSSFLRQIPVALPNELSKARNAAKGQTKQMESMVAGIKFFTSLKKFLSP